MNTETTAENGKPFDPLESFRKLRDAGMDSWAKTMVELVNTEGYAQSSGAVLDACLTASSPMRETMEKVMVRALEQLSMPTRADVIALAQRFTNIEMRLDDLDAKLDHIAQDVRKTARKTTKGAK